MTQQMQDLAEFQANCDPEVFQAALKIIGAASRNETKENFDPPEYPDLLHREIEKAVENLAKSLLTVAEQLAQFRDILAQHRFHCGSEEVTRQLILVLEKFNQERKSRRKSHENVWKTFRFDEGGMDVLRSRVLQRLIELGKLVLGPKDN